MAYSDFSFDRARKELGLTIRVAPVFVGLSPLTPPAWLLDALRRGQELPRVTEKARSELLITPVLLAARELSGKAFTIFSGHTLVGDPDRGLTGECDFILARSEPVPSVSGPLVTIVEAKKSDIDLGVGQCIAQMVGARLFNQRDGIDRPVFGCVTTGQLWQFLRLDGDVALSEPDPIGLAQLGSILAALVAATA